MSLEWIEPNFSNPESPFIPPLEARTYDLHKKGRLPTPIDKVTGLVDKRALVNLVKGTVVPGYDWTSPLVPKPTTTRHHLLWPRTWFDQQHDLRGHGSLSSSMPRIAHNWTHDVTYPAAPPTAEVGHDYMRGRSLANDMMVTARHPAFLAKETFRIHQEVYADLSQERLDTLMSDIKEDTYTDLTHQLETFSKLFDAAKAEPGEFQVIEYGNLELRNVKDMLRIAHKIGRQVTMEAAIDKELLPPQKPVSIAA